ncbi:MAG: hypothetical protein WCH32_08890, partial [Pseudomonadota bacterium]
MDAEHALRAIVRSVFLLPLGPILVAALGLWLARRRPRAGHALAAAALAALLLLSVPVLVLMPPPRHALSLALRGRGVRLARACRGDDS